MRDYYNFVSTNQRQVLPPGGGTLHWLAAVGSNPPIMSPSLYSWNGSEGLNSALSPPGAAGAAGGADEGGGRPGGGTLALKPGGGTVKSIAVNT